MLFVDNIVLIDESQVKLTLARLTTNYLKYKFSDPSYEVCVEVRFDTHVILRVNFKYLRSLLQENREINMISHIILMLDELRPSLV
ncbi:hypothetical protein H5410_044384 [Solanum commersonii]|uniref:Uncharacterized protein n=1 Tax=Solanum commersonii TaxID=4109 RepID=A0A9J5X9J7_SOLCO|nr:hypothetical protein H5410_044384 [Solanum commersonii]